MRPVPGNEATGGRDELGAFDDVAFDSVPWPSDGDGKGLRIHSQECGNGPYIRDIFALTDKVTTFAAREDVVGERLRVSQRSACDRRKSQTGNLGAQISFLHATH